MKFLKISEGVEGIARQMIDNPHDWYQGQYEYSNKTHIDISIWNSSGASNLRISGFDGLTWAEKHYLSNAIKKSIAQKLTTTKPKRL